MTFKQALQAYKLARKERLRAAQEYQQAITLQQDADVEVARCAAADRQAGMLLAEARLNLDAAAEDPEEG